MREDLDFDWFSIDDNGLITGFSLIKHMTLFLFPYEIYNTYRYKFGSTA